LISPARFLIVTWLSSKILLGCVNLVSYKASQIQAK
jgi:hypothetical protein